MTATERVEREVFGGEDLVREMTLASLDFRYFLRNHVYIADRSPSGDLRGILKFEWWPIHDYICDLLEQESRLVILKARQVGLSWIMAAYQLWGAIFRPSYLGAQTSAGQTEASELLSKAAFILAHLPYSSIPTLSTENKSELRFDATDGAVMAFPSTPNAGRGYTLSVHVADEAAFHEYAAVNYEAYSIAAEYGQIIILSSAGDDEDRGHANPWFNIFWHSARDGRNGFKAVFIPYSARPGRDEAWYARESERLSGRPGAMQREFPATPEEAFRSMLLLYFDVDAIDEGLEYANSMRPLSSVHAQGFPSSLQDPLSRGHLRIWSTPRPGTAYVLGIDGAEGKGQDYTVTTIMEARTLRVVGVLRENVLEPAQHGLYAAALAKWFNDAWCMVERSHGESIIVQLTLAGCRVYKTYPERRPGAALDPDAQPLGTPGMPMTGQTRPGLLEDLSLVIHDRSFSSPAPIFWQEAATFIVLPTGRAEASTRRHDDCIMSAVYCVRMARQPGATSVRFTSYGLGDEGGQPFDDKMPFSWK